MLKRFMVPAVILVILVSAGFLVLNNPPDTQRRGPPGGPQTVVEVAPVVSESFNVTVNSYGTVQPRTQSALVAQVSGQIVSVSDSFRAGGFFQPGETLLTIDPRDYQADVHIAEAALMDALQAQAQEQARADQAQTDWQRIGNEGEAPSELVLRKPQLQAAKARVRSAESNLTKAQLDLERTRISAPFSGRVRAQMVDVGQVVTVGARLADIYATDYVEIRLPVRNADLRFVDLPEQNATEFPLVTITSSLGEDVSWQGRIVRTESAIDETARQLHVVAQINDPFGTENSVARPLKIGEYVTATIKGKALDQVIVVPNTTLYQNSYVYVVRDGVLERRDVDIAWQDSDRTVLARGLTVGEQLVTTPLGQVTSGTPVRITGEQMANTPKSDDGAFTPSTGPQSSTRPGSGQGHQSGRGAAQ